MNAALTLLASLIEFGGALAIAAHVSQAAWSVLRRGSPTEARQTTSRGLAAGLDFTLAATLLKTISLASWHQIGLFGAIFAVRLIVKRALLSPRADSGAR